MRVFGVELSPLRTIDSIYSNYGTWTVSSQVDLSCMSWTINHAITQSTAESLSLGLPRSLPYLRQHGVLSFQRKIALSHLCAKCAMNDLSCFFFFAWQDLRVSDSLRTRTMTAHQISCLSSESLIEPSRRYRISACGRAVTVAVGRGWF